MNQATVELQKGQTFEEFKKEVLADYKLANVSRSISMIGRREVLTGKAKFGIFGDGKEVLRPEIEPETVNARFPGETDGKGVTQLKRFHSQIGAVVDITV